MADGSEDPSDHCQRLPREWVNADFSQLVGGYTPGATVDTVNGALGPLFYATMDIAGTPASALVDPGSSATIMSFELFRTIGTMAAIPSEALQPSCLLNHLGQLEPWKQFHVKLCRSWKSLCRTTAEGLSLYPLR